ncbi:MAG: hypothetical protein NZ578_01135 [Candidatus Binatia bacterium]|nr:hypothetical protein [Candidatus Binatia bacterium]
MTALLKAVRHPRIVFYEHDVGGELELSPPAKATYFPVFADFDVEAQNEERAADLVEEVLEDLSTDTVQFFAVGVTPGERRVVQKVSPEETRRPEPGGRAERGEKRRRSRGRGKQRQAPQGAEMLQEEAPVSAAEGEAAAPGTSAETPVAAAPEPARAEAQPVAGAHAAPPQPVGSAEGEILLPPRSSPSMHVTLSVSFHVAELLPQFNGSALPEQQELLALAMAEAQRRYPELPVGLTPDSELVAHPWGETILTLTWRYDVPVPSAVETTPREEQ